MIPVISGLACLVLSFLIGLSVQEAANPLMVTPFLLTGAWLVGSGRLATLSFRDPVLWGVLALGALWLQSLFVSGFTFNSKVTLLTLGILPLSFMMWRTLALSAQTQARVAMGVLGVGLLCACHALYEEIFLKEWRPAWPFLDANLLGILFSLTLLSLLPFTLKAEQDKRLRAALIAAATLLVAGLLVTQSRSAFIGTVAGMGYIAFQLRHQIPRTRAFLIGLGAACMAALAAAFTTGLLSRFALLLSGDIDASSRLSIWGTAFDMNLLHPLRGFGAGTFGMVYPLYREPGGDNSLGWWVHMDPLQWAVESGWSAAIVFYALAGYIGYRIYKLRDRSPLQIGFIAALLSLFINAHTAYPLHVIPFMIMATGMVHALIPAPVQAPRSVTYAGAGILMIVVTLGMWTAVNSARTLFSWQQVQAARLTNVYENFEGEMMHCLERADPDFPFCRLLLIETTLQMQMSMHIAPATLTMIKDLQQQFPLLPQPDYFLGVYLEKTDFANTAAAIDAYKASVIKMPTFWIARRALIEALMRDKQYLQALATLESGAKYPLPKAARAYHAAMKTELSARITP